MFSKWSIWLFFLIILSIFINIIQPVDPNVPRKIHIRDRFTFICDKALISFILNWFYVLHHLSLIFWPTYQSKALYLKVLCVMLSCVLPVASKFSFLQISISLSQWLIRFNHNSSITCLVRHFCGVSVEVNDFEYKYYLNWNMI